MIQARRCSTNLQFDVGDHAGNEMVRLATNAICRRLGEGSVTLETLMVFLHPRKVAYSNFRTSTVASVNYVSRSGRARIDRKRIKTNHFGENSFSPEVVSKMVRLPTALVTGRQTEQ